ncbi:MAG: FAD-dependent monooxygenase [Alphaproteobacteria bacterium]
MAEARTKKYGVVIAGGGFAGGTLALALARLTPKPFRVALVDAAPRAPMKKDARGLALSAAATRLLDAVGLWPALAPNAQPIESIEVTDSPLNADLRPHFLGFDTELNTGAPSAYLVEAGEFLSVISDAVAAEPAIDVFAPDSIDDFATDAFGVEAHLASGLALRAPLLVGADGKRSRLREVAGIKCIGWSYPQSGIVATVTHEHPHNGKAVQHFLPAGPFAILPLKGNRSSIVWTEEAANAKSLMAGDEAAFVAELTRRFGHRLGTISLEGRPQSFPLAFQMARSFVGKRLALVGDAAHVVHPLAGQGLNIGLRDVAALTETIVDALRLGLDIGSSVTLERYQRWRRFDSAFSGTVMDAMNRLFSTDNAPLRAIRDLGLGIVDRSPGLKRFLVREAAGGTGDVPRLMKGEAL